MTFLMHRPGLLVSWRACGVIPVVSPREGGYQPADGHVRRALVFWIGGGLRDENVEGFSIRPHIMTAPMTSPARDTPARDSADAVTAHVDLAPATARPAAVQGRSGAIILTRHGEPALSRKCMLSAAEYGDWWARYEVGGLLAGQTPPAELMAAVAGAGMIYSSTRLRAVETATAVADGRDVTSDALFIEAPLPPPNFPDWIKLSPKWWGGVSRFWWHFFNHHAGQETRAQADVRAAQAARILIDRAAEGHDVIVFAHGYFNHMVGRRLKSEGWRLVHNQGFKYWSQRRFEKR